MHFACMPAIRPHETLTTSLSRPTTSMCFSPRSDTFTIQYYILLVYYDRLYYLQYPISKFWLKFEAVIAGFPGCHIESTLEIVSGCWKKHIDFLVSHFLGCARLRNLAQPPETKSASLLMLPPLPPQWFIFCGLPRRRVPSDSFVICSIYTKACFRVLGKKPWMPVLWNEVK